MKNRSLPTNYWGSLGTNTYVNRETQFYPSDLEYWSDYLGFEHDYWSTRAAAHMAASSFVGEEVFDSTRRPKPKMNNCFHTKVQAHNVPFGILYQRYYYDLAWYRNPYTRLPYPYAGFTGELVPTNWDTSGAARRAWWNMQPRFEGEISMLNFLFELKDFKDVMKFALRPKASYNKMSRLLRRTPKSPINTVTKGAAGGFLTWKLAIKPLLRDLASIHAQLATLVREKQEEFKSLGSQDQSSHYSETLDEVIDYVPGTSNYYWRGLGTYERTSFTATMHYNYAYEMRETVDAFVRYWGLNPTAEAFWNAIPFSFIVDYFIGINNSLHAMRVDRNVDLHWTDYAESTLTEILQGYISIPDDRVAALYIDLEKVDTGYHHLLSGFRGSIYDRRVCLPNYGPALPRLKKASGNQWLTMAAIVRCLL